LTDCRTTTDLLGHSLIGRVAAPQEVGQVVRQVILPLRLPELLWGGETESTEHVGSLLDWYCHWTKTTTKKPPKQSLTNCILDPLVFGGGFALTGTQASLQPLHLLGDALPVGAHQIHCLGLAGGLLASLSFARVSFTNLW